MGENTLKFDNIRVNKKEFHKSKQPIDLKSVKVDQIVVYDKFKHNDDGFKYFIFYREGKIVKPLSIILNSNASKMVAKYVFFIKDDDVGDKYNEIWDKIKEKLNIKFHSISVYDETYIKTKVREFNGVIKTNFLGGKVPKENMPYITIDSVTRMQKKNYPQVYLEQCKCRVKKIQMSRFRNTELKIGFRIRIRH